MPLDDIGTVSPHANRLPPEDALQVEVAHLNAALRHHSATDVLRRAVEVLPNLALVSSFGAESVALLHLASMVKRDLPVLFIDTQMLFTETLVYQQELSERLGLHNVRIIKAADLETHDPDGTLHQRDTDACCDLRKTRPLAAALEGYDGWISGRKRFQSGTRAALEFFEVEAGTDNNPARIKVNPLAYWSSQDVADYIDENRLPRHPLVAKGFPSIGCAPCTSKVAPGEDARAGRWRDQDKEECGIHFVNGKMVRTGDMT
ncbi:phosphoadenylyl-sulfate reductase [Sulfitobacter mediterraneus]|uniref:phosphoadenylyl-sulfate reductase n=1 Tax=Sulfitobacter mediterraneus TaxID=83219 RepID=UPI001934660A|nr:phosphoadenylyl-sulfate reductase [Sulfitobacter mediterraneus]MBM1631829.1 phosphoadenylyl-sulfate reductase [Sulfitobacter mediterraneus]MBM1639644.1 phosphoadenylyl-sulfate reductase [Sulfitobacter mediterraneus]MBM1643693.1 phosphoadenylyl-sulfate reductase [Sulfitobacter mediterraneus]MBM1647739.1 phosphoadenylyl-sulfate reductase [Sulfitobacter mediterraneus]MBM1651784.1 phosphoadenylyl-sulfate reductase [Sulfitobacter mediterraneus]